MKRTSLHSRQSAFTLIEVLTVVAIIAMLAAMGFAGLRFAMSKAKEKDTMALLTDVGKAIEGYKDDRGAYPRPSFGEDEIQIEGKSFRIGGARMLYQALSGDGNDAIKGGDKISNGQMGSARTESDPDAGTVYMDSLQAPTQQQIEEKKKLKLVESSGDSSYYLIDPWRHPLQYQVPERDKNGLVANAIMMHSNSNFELWSYGSAKDAEESEENKQKWITNWNMR